MAGELIKEEVFEFKGITYRNRKTTDGLLSVTGGRHPEGSGIYYNLPECQCGRTMVSADPQQHRSVFREFVRRAASAFACPMRGLERGHDSYVVGRGYARGRPG